MRYGPALLLGLAVAFGACASNGDLPPVAAAQHTISESVAVGSRNASNRPNVTLPVRYNPADCECPGWEVRAFGRWIRVFLDSDDTAHLTALRHNDDPLATANITGRFSETPRLSERNVRYPVFSTN